MIKIRRVWLILMIIVMMVIFTLSNQPAKISTEFSNTVAEAIKIKPENDWTPPSLTKIVFGFDLRKLAHIGLFALLGVTAIGFTMNTAKTFLICLCYAVFDEIHQFFVYGRTASIKDVAIDAIGFCAVIVIWKIILQLIHIKQKINQ